MFARLNLEFLRKRAKELLIAARAGDADALRRIQRAHPTFGRPDPEAIRGTIALHDALLVVAREHGFSSWMRLKAYVDELASCGEPSPLERLQAAIRAGELDVVPTLIATHPSLLSERAEPLGWTPMHTAASVGSEECLRMLLDAGADINARDVDMDATPLHTAIGFGHPGAARLLVERGAGLSARNAIGATMLQKAAYAKDTEMIRLLAASGVPLDIFAAVALEDVQMVRKVVGRSPDSIREHMPVSRNTRMTPLHLAAFHDEVAMIALLLELGADIAARDEQSRTPIDLALNAGNKGAYESLKAHGATPDPSLLGLVESPARAERMARLHAALMDDDVDAMARLLDEDPSLLNARLPDVWGSGGTYGAAPLHWAAFLGRLESVRFLLKRGADLAVTDLTYGGTPLSWACQSRRSSEVIALLKAHGAA